MTATILDRDTTMLEHLDFEAEVPCGYNPTGEVCCPTGDPAKWRMVIHTSCGCYAPQLICEACRHRHRLHEQECARLLALGLATMHCGLCGALTDWQPAQISPLAGSH